MNCVDFHKGDKPYLVSGDDDHLIKIWDYQTKQCLNTLESHCENITDVKYHPQLPILLSSSEDGAVKIWNSITYRLENTLEFCIDYCLILIYK